MKNNEINLFELDELPRYVEIAYKKLKNSIFFDKSNVITRNDLVEFEYGDQWENKLKDLAASLTDSAKWESKVKEIFRELVRHSKFVFSHLFSKEKCSKMEIITAFSGVLELNRKNKIQVKQDTLFGDIYIEKAPKKV